MTGYDIDAQLDAYLRGRGAVDMPPEMVSATLDAARRTPQASSRLSWVPLTLAAAGAAAVIVVALAVIALERRDVAGPSVSVLPGPSTTATLSSTPSPSTTAALSSTPSADPSGRDLESLAVGDAISLECRGDSPPQFSEGGDLFVCGSDIYGWPSLERVSAVVGSPMGWGQLDDRDHLLVDRRPSGFFVVIPVGDEMQVAAEPLSGRTLASWAPDRRSVWLRTGVQTPTLTLIEWTPAGGSRVIASIANDINAAFITVSPDRQWIAAWAVGCTTGGIPLCGVSGTMSRLDGTGTVIPLDVPGHATEIAFLPDSSYYFLLQNPSAHELWHGVPGQEQNPVATGGIWRLADGAFAVAADNGLEYLDLVSGVRRPLSAGTELAGREVISIAPSARWAAAWSDASQTGLAVFPLDEPGPPIQLEDVSDPLDLPPIIVWPPDDDFLMFSGAVATDFRVARLAD